MNTRESLSFDQVIQPIPFGPPPAPPPRGVVTLTPDEVLAQINRQSLIPEPDGWAYGPPTRPQRRTRRFKTRPRPRR